MIILCFQLNTSLAQINLPDYLHRTAWLKTIIKLLIQFTKDKLPIYGLIKKLIYVAKLLILLLIMTIKTINILYRNGPSPICPSPIPPGYFRDKEIRKLEAGSYTVNHHSVPFVHDFPPIESDYPNYLIDSAQLSVLKTITVDSSSTYSLAALVLLLLCFSFFYQRKQGKQVSS